MNKGLEAFRRICDALDCGDEMIDSLYEVGDIELVETQLRALYIMRVKRVDIWYLRRLIDRERYGYIDSALDEFNKTVASKDKELTVEEVNILQKVFG